MILALFLIVRRTRGKHADMNVQPERPSNPYGIEVAPTEVQHGDGYGITAVPQQDENEMKQKIGEGYGIETVASTDSGTRLESGSQPGQ